MESIESDQRWLKKLSIADAKKTKPFAAPPPKINKYLRRKHKGRDQFTLKPTLESILAAISTETNLIAFDFDDSRITYVETKVWRL